MRVWIALFLGSLTIFAQEPGRLEYTCPAAELESFGLACSAEDPCEVFLYLSSVETAGAKLFASGNLHTGATTLFGILLESEDQGKTWTEPLPRVRSAELEQIQFLDTEHGWTSGQLIQPLPADPFLLMTSDGGKSWRERPLFEETRIGFIDQFWFDSPAHGQVVFAHPQGAATRYELLDTTTAGQSWTSKGASETPPLVKREIPGWRVRADGPTKTYRIEHAAGSAWENVASFAIHVTNCGPAQ